MQCHFQNNCVDCPLGHLCHLSLCQVRIVLEFCDSGSLREALDNNIFMQNDIFNYLAVLDTVLDISRAILHLHK